MHGGFALAVPCEERLALRTRPRLEFESRQIASSLPRIVPGSGPTSTGLSAETSIGRCANWGHLGSLFMLHGK